MNLLTLYKEKHIIEEWRKSMSSSGANQMGGMYNFYNTNFRNLNRYINAVEDFQPYEGKSRESWPKQKSGQEKFKHYVTFLTSTKLYRLQDSKYYLTEKGRTLSSMISQEFNKEEKWILTYILFLDAYYERKPNYFIETTKNIISQFPKYVDVGEIIKSMESFLMGNYSTEGRYYEDALYYHAFYADSELLNLYYNSSIEDKKLLQEYVGENHRRKKFNDVISYKLKPNGTVQFRTIYDEVLTFYLSYQLIELLKTESFLSAIDALILSYVKIYKNVDPTKVKKFIVENESVFEAVYLNFQQHYDQLQSTDLKQIEDIDVSELNIGPEEWIDSTTISGVSKINSIFEKRKTIAKEAAHYRCFFESLERCSYFTSKTDKNNYVEVHHLVPREYRNDFEYSIEVLENYVVLCPSCHKKVHLAVCNERKHMINFMFEKRYKSLKRKGISVDYRELLEMYRCE